MSLNWIDVKSLIAEAAAYDGDSSQSLTNMLVGTAADIRFQLLLRNFSVETLSFYTRAVPVTFNDSDFENVDLTDGSRCSVSMCKVLSVNFNSTMLRHVEGTGLLQQMTAQRATATGIPVKGTPVAWAESDYGRISFEVPIDASASPTAWVSGWYRHPVISYDTAAAAVAAGKSGSLGQFQLDEKLAIPFSKVAAISIKENVSSVQIAIERLNRLDRQGYTAIKEEMNRNLARYHRGLYNNPGLSYGGMYGWPH